MPVVKFRILRLGLYPIVVPERTGGRGPRTRGRRCMVKATVQRSRPLKGAGCRCGLCIASVMLFCAVANTLSAQQAPVGSMIPIPGDLVSGGPSYDYRVGTYQITNDEFVAFLNDAIANLDNERGSYLYHDTDSGNVFVHSSVLGAIGASGSGTLIFRASDGGVITYNGTSQAYEVAGGSVAGRMPAVGSTWYGAVKYCNWLTLDSGLSLGQRAYDEASSSNLSGWHPATISTANWAVRDLNASERATLLALMGYRLPMDDGQMTASAYNEWYKAAAWDSAGGVHHLYGFGRDTIGAADANYWSSGDPFEAGLTPAGFFGVGGLRNFADGQFGWGVEPPTDYAVTGTSNAFGLYDMSGNVWEWLQDQTSNPSRRALRGGSWVSVIGSLETDERSNRTATSPVGFVGFRVAQSAPQSLMVTPDVGFSASGPFGGPYDFAQLDYALTNLTDQAVTYGVSSDADWISINGGASLAGIVLPAFDATDPQVHIDTVSVALSGDCSTAQAVVGNNQAVVTITDEGTQATAALLTIDLALTEPLTVTPDVAQDASALIGGPVTPATINYTIDSVSASVIDWEVTADVTWLTINGLVSGGAPVSGNIAALGQQLVVVGFDSSVASLLAGQYTAQLTFTDTCTGQQFVRSIILDIGVSVAVDPLDDASFQGSTNGTVEPASTLYTFSNPSGDAIDWLVHYEPANPAWLEINGAVQDSGNLAGGGSLPITITPAASATLLAPGTYVSTLFFSDLTNGLQASRTLTLIISEYEVTPLTDWSPIGPAGGPFAPSSETYTISYFGVGNLLWDVVYVTDDGANWLDINGGLSDGGTISEQGQTMALLVTTNALADSLMPGTYSATVTIGLEDTFFARTEVARTVTLQVGGDVPSLDMVSVPANGQDQPLGPAHDFRISRFEVTNAEYIAHLNDALANLGNERGQYMFIATDTGNVYIHSAQTGSTGLDAGGAIIFDAVINGHVVYTDGIGFSIDDLANDDQPASGVSWYGALKYCNWLTVATSLDIDQRVYSEAANTNLNGWHPVTISGTDWATRDLDSTEKASLLDLWGYRLPMDDGQSAASTYNEWFKAAAWDPGALANRVYGFGRDTITGSDANYLASGDLFDDGTTPTGYFDGINAGTADTANGFSLYDMSGNVWEWVQDRGTTLSARGVRGGSWFDASSVLQAALRASKTASAVDNSTGFRVVQSLPHPVLVTPDVGLTAVGPYGGDYDNPLQIYVLSNLSDSTVNVTVSSDKDWITIDGQSSPVLYALAPGDQTPVLVAIMVDCMSSDAALGAITATVAVTDDATANVMAERAIGLTLTEPLSITPTDIQNASGLVGGPFLPAPIDFTFDNASASSIDWEVTADVDWVTINGTQGLGLPVAGTSLPLGQDVISIGFDPLADLLTADSYTATLTFTNTCTGQDLIRFVVLTVNPPISVDPSIDATFEGPIGGPTSPSSFEYAVTNLTESQIQWASAVAYGPEASGWLDLDMGTNGTLESLAVAVTTLSPNAAVNALAVGTYSATVTFSDLTHGFTIDREVVLTLSEFDVDPTTEFVSLGPVGGPFQPIEQVYTITNDSQVALQWLATTEYTTAPLSGVAWLSLNGDVQAQGVIAEVGGTEDLSVTINPAAVSLGAGQYSAVVHIIDSISGVEVTRNLTLRVGVGGFTVPMAVVASGGQVNGPSYDYRIGITEVTNAQYAEFLTNAAANLTNERGSYLYHDVDSGDVYLSAAFNGVIGSDGQGTLIFESADGGAISYDAAQQRYAAATAKGNLPVVGVSWYGAVKFSNWMTLVQGMSPADQAYTEGATEDEWHPATIATVDWLVRDLDAAERLALVSASAAFRLPMDDASGAENPYNEWYKAAAWLPDTGTDAVYGFGRNLLTSDSANYQASGDPFDDDVTPTQFYGIDGNRSQTDPAFGWPIDPPSSFSVLDTANGFGLYDMCGNAAEWVQDQKDAPNQRATRGGSALRISSSAQLRNDTRGVDLAAATRADTGFRIVQSAMADALAVTPAAGLVTTGVVGGPITGLNEMVYTLSGSTSAPNEWTITSDVNWLDIDGAAAAYGVLPPAALQMVTVSLNQQALELFSPGDYAATVTFTDSITGVMVDRIVDFTLTEAIGATPTADIVAVGPFRGNQPPADAFVPLLTTYTLTNLSETVMGLEASADVNWVDVSINTNGFDPASLATNDQVFVDVTFNTAAQALAPGLHEGTVSLTNTVTGNVQTRLIELTVTDALQIDSFDSSGPLGPFTLGFEGHAIIANCLTAPGLGPLDDACSLYDWDGDGDMDLADYAAYDQVVWQGAFGIVGVTGDTLSGLQAQYTYDVLNLLSIALHYVVSTEVNWLDLAGTLDGNLAANPEMTSIFTDINTNANSLPPGRYEGILSFAYDDVGIGSSETRSVWLMINDPLSIDPGASILVTYNPEDDPTAINLGTLTLTNQTADQSLDWSIAVSCEAPCDSSWLTLSGDTGGTLPGGALTIITPTLDASAQSLVEGEYQADLTFTNLTSARTAVRSIMLTVDEALRVAPLAGLDGFGIQGEQGVSPSAQLYTMTNLADESLTWSASADQPWVELSTNGGSISTNGIASLTVTILPTHPDPIGVATVTITAVGSGALIVVTRPVTVTLTGAFDENTIPGDDGQPGGPTYAFEIAPFEVTNEEFANFLNDTYALVGCVSACEKGEYMYHDTDSSDVYVNTISQPEAGTTGSDTLTTKMYSAVDNDSRITFDSLAGSYVVTAGFELHPVTGTSWFGAIKFCNWLTLDRGISAVHRCYLEGPASDLSTWRPVVIAKPDWQSRDLNDTERADLIQNYRGYRLPMDDGANNVNSFTDGADAYNEWYKAAAWDPIGLVNRVYGFGADDLDTNGGDCNYKDNGDPFDNATTPVGFFGTNGLRTWDDPDFGWGVTPPDSFAVLDGSNAYGLYDMSGNVVEWVQGRYGSGTSHALRGGSWQNFAAQSTWILATDRFIAPPTFTWTTVGFRVGRVAVPPG